jgi:hypothetical protein
MGASGLPSGSRVEGGATIGASAADAVDGGEITATAGTEASGKTVSAAGCPTVGAEFIEGDGKTGSGTGADTALGAEASLFRGPVAEGVLEGADPFEDGAIGRGESGLEAMAGGVTTGGLDAAPGETGIDGGRVVAWLGRTIVGTGGGDGGAGTTTTGLQRVPGAGGPPVALSGFRKRNVIRSLSPIAL